MKGLDEMIKELCPNGVEFVKLVKYVNVQYGFAFDSKLFTDDEQYIPLIRIRDVVPAKPSTYYSGEYCSDYIIRKGDMLVGMDGNFNMEKWNDRDGLLNQRVCKIYAKDESLLLDGFLYHYLRPLFKKIENSIQGSTVKHLSAKVINHIEIPLPPIEVQTEIVRILDKFTSLEAELETEIEAEIDCRKRQYEYYRDKLLSFNNEGGQEVEWKKMSEVCEIYDGTHQTPKYQTEGIPFISVENIKDIYGSNKYISIEAYEAYKVKPKVGDVFMTRIGSIGACAVFTKQEDVACYVSLALLRPNSAILDSRFLKHLIESSIGKRELSKRTLHNAVPIKINKSDIGKIKLPVPSLSEQERMATILDRFESLTTSLQTGLPAEITARRQQYEYYRDKLLTFKRKGAA